MELQRVSSVTKNKRYREFGKKQDRSSLVSDVNFEWPLTTYLNKGNTNAYTTNDSNVALDVILQSLGTAL